MKLRTGFLTILVVLFFAVAVSAADTWVEVRSANFHLVGNASEKDIKDVAIKLEQFRHIFGLLFPKIKLGDSIETNVLVFKNQSSYLPFLPKRPDGTPDKGIAGYFLGAEDANFITLSVTKGDAGSAFEIIFHEYIHYLLKSNFKRSEIPPWLNEGLAEYYSTFEVSKDQKAMLGNLRNDHLYFLANNDLIPLKEFFAVDNYSLHSKGDHSRTVFYAQAWALIHYFAVKNEANKLTNFMDLAKTMPEEEAFKKALGHDYAGMEEILKKYAKQRKFTRLIASFQKKFEFDKEVVATPLSEAESLAYMGELLYRQQDYWTAEGYLKRSLEADPDGVRANTALGLIKMQTKDFAEARKYLEKSVSSKESGYMAFYSYAYVLNREGSPEGGFVLGYKEDTAQKIRAALKKALELKPDFVPAYTLAGFVNIVTGENLDEAVGYFNKALSIKPGDERSTIYLAQALMRLKKYDEAEKLATGILESADNESARRNASSLLDSIRRFRDFEARSNGTGVRIGTGTIAKSLGVQGKILTEEEVEKIQLERRISGMNRNLSDLKEGEMREIGFIEKISCNGNIVSYRVKTLEGNIVSFRSDGFQNLELMALTDLTNDDNISCNFNSSDVKAVFRYAPVKSKTIAGTLKSITFVPDFFRVKSEEEMASDSNVMMVHPEGGEPQAVELKGGSQEEEKADTERILSEIRLSQLRGMLRVPKKGEKRIVGTIEKIQCDSRGFGVFFKKGNELTAYWTKSPESMQLASFGSKFDQSALACGGTPSDSLVVLTFVPSNGDLSTAGRIVAMEFVEEDPKIEQQN